MIIPILLLLFGLGLLWLGADFVVESAKKLAQKFRVSQFFIGLTIVSIGTSLPEIFTTITSGISNLKGVPASGFGVGINIGASIGQITLIVGLVALLGSLHTRQKTLNRDGTAIFLSIIALFLMGLSGFISRLEGIILVIAYVGYLVYLSIDERNERRESPLLAEPVDALGVESKKLRNKPAVVCLIMLAGILLLAMGSSVVVRNALKISDGFNLAQTFVGVLILGVGGFLPELSTAIKGIFNKAQDISLATLIGSNITDPLLSLGLGAIISGLTFDREILFFELPFWALSVLTVMLLLKRNMKVEHHERRQGIALIALYLLFIFMKITFFRYF